MELAVLLESLLFTPQIIPNHYTGQTLLGFVSPAGLDPGFWGRCTWPAVMFEGEQRGGSPAEWDWRAF